MIAANASCPNDADGVLARCVATRSAALAAVQAGVAVADAYQSCKNGWSMSCGVDAAAAALAVAGGAGAWKEAGRAAAGAAGLADDAAGLADDASTLADDAARTGDDAAGTADDVERSCPSHSFDRDTPVLMADGSFTSISDVEVGDEVLTLDPSTGEQSARTVTATHVMAHDGDPLDVTIAGDRGEGVVRTTVRHLFWSVTDDAREPASDLSVGERLLDDQGAQVTVRDVRGRSGRDSMWDLTVEVDHDFYVAFGAGAVLVHNQNDAGKNDPHGDAGRALSKAEEQIAELEEQLLDKTLTRRQKVAIKNKISNIKQAAEKAAKGETHGRRAKGC